MTTENPKPANIYDFNINELANLMVTDFHQPKFRAKQVFEWLYKGIQSFDEMSNLPIALREDLKKNFSLRPLQLVEKFISVDSTEKYLSQFPDGYLIETVKMEYHHGISACISTQVGCKMNCAFCASGKDGFFRNLSAGEMILQILLIQDQTKKRVSNIVLMGSGEPLDNFEQVSKFLELIHEKSGLNIGYRHVTLSTCGIIPKIDDLAKLNLPITLAISLHAPIDSIRNQLIPINRKYPIQELIKACKDYVAVTSRRITFEYSLIKDYNDSFECASILIKLLSGLLCHVNLIPVNSTNIDFSPTPSSHVQEFQKILIDGGINATIRRTLGSDIEAACGQLKCRYLNDHRST